MPTRSSDPAPFHSSFSRVGTRFRPLARSWFRSLPGMAAVAAGSAALVEMPASGQFQPWEARKANNIDNLNLSSSWLDPVPDSTKVGFFYNTFNNAGTILLGADMSWLGIEVSNPITAVTIGGGNTLTLAGAGLVAHTARSTTQ